jgi:O-antigen biosynthesis protein WbqP
MKRLIDVSVSCIVLLLFAVPMLLAALAILLTSKGPVFYWSDRVGRNNRVFRMPKFRSMRIDTPLLPSDLLTDASFFVTPVGRLLRRTSFDELPQLLSVIRGDMSLVGPRPALANQADLIALRTERGIHRLLPGITGWAQINGRDYLLTPQKVVMDHQYLAAWSFWLDLKILCITAAKVVLCEDVSH